MWVSYFQTLPSFLGTDAHQVALTLRGEVQDPPFLRFLERIGDEKLASFDTHDFLTMDAIRREVALSGDLSARLPRLRDLGVVESIGRGRGTQYLLSRAFYGAIGELAVYTRRKGLDHETNKALVVNHLETRRSDGCALEELQQVIPHVSRSTVQRMLRELRQEGKAVLKGTKRWARWFPKPQNSEMTHRKP